MKTLLYFVVALFSVAESVTDEEKKYTYNVAVVEYLAINNYSIPAAERINLDALEMINLLKSVKEDLDLILYPESSLAPGGGFSSVSSEVPEPFGTIICNSVEDKYKAFLKTFSCAAIEYNTTVVVNIVEKVNCTFNNSTGYCPSSGIIYHNTNVAFNEKGQVSGRYRKWNLFGEYNVSPPSEVELVTIKTKNNDLFGVITCFDIQFGQPALNLTRHRGIKNILFPNRWYSELPYLTSLQVQQMWAEENNVNLLVSGASNPTVGSGGSGIYIGNDGPLVQDIIGGTGGTKIWVKRVPRPEIENNPYKVVPSTNEEDVDAIAKEMDNLYLLIDSSIYGHTSIPLNTSNTETIHEVCNGDVIKTCCQFHVRISANQNATTINKKQYTYHLAAFNGVRTYSGLRDGGIESCGVIACLNETISSCGQRFTNYTEISWPITFEYIKVIANFTMDENRIQFPNSLLSSIRPISPQHTTWEKEELGEMVNRRHTLNTPQNRLLTFGIFGRDFNRDSPIKNTTLPSNNKSEANVSSILQFCIILLFTFLLKRTS